MTTDERQRELLERLLGPRESEVGCDECFELIDQYVELEIAGVDAAARLPGVHAHFGGCPACREEHDALVELARSTPGHRHPSPRDLPSEPRRSPR